MLSYLQEIMVQHPIKEDGKVLRSPPASFRAFGFTPPAAEREAQSKPAGASGLDGHRAPAGMAY